MQQEKLRSLCYGLIAVVGAGLLAYLFMRYLLVLLLPFAIAWCVGMVIRRPSDYLASRTGISVKLWRLLLTAVLIIGILTLLGLGVYRLSLELWHFLERLGQGEALPGLSALGGGGLLGGVISGFGEQVGEGIYQLLVKLLGSFADFLSGILSSVPRVALGSLVTVIASVYLALDIDKVNGTMLGLIPDGARPTVDRIRSGFLTVGVRYLRSYLILMGITLCVMLTGLLVLRVPTPITGRTSRSDITNDKRTA